MTERNERDDKTNEHLPAEGVRIIPAEEAQAALEAGAAAGRRPDDQLRFGDVPPAPSGPRPTHRFPLPTSVDPAEVPHPPVAAPVRSEDRVAGPRPARTADVEVDDEPTVVVPAGTGIGTEDPAPRWEPPVPSFAPPTTASAVSPTPIGPGGTVPPSSRLPVEPGGPSLPSVDPSRAGDSWDTGAWRSDDWGLSTEAPTDAAATPVPEERDPDPWRAPPTRSAATGWEPPPGWGPEPGPPAGPPSAGPTSTGPTSTGPTPAAPAWDAPLEVPVWDSPLDSAEGISASPHSWTPPEAWADPTHAGDGRPMGWSAPTERSDVGPAEGYPPADPTVAARWEPEIASFGADPARPDPDVGADDGPLATPERTPPPDEGITVTGGFGTDLPHWTDPPTGEVPRMRPEGAEGPESDDLEAWQALGSSGGANWRDDAEDWDDLGGLGDLGSDETRVGALDSSRSEHSDLYSFDEDFERLDEERSGQHRVLAEDLPPAEGFEAAPERISTSVRASAAARAARVARSRSEGQPPGGPSDIGGRDMGSAVVVGAGLVVLLIIAYAIGSKGLLVLSVAVLLACAVEVFGMVQRRGFKPATLLGLVATVGVVFAAYWRGAEALPLVTAVMFVATMCWYLFGVVEARPLANVSATLMAFLWVGLLGSFAALLLRAPHGRGLFLGVVLPVVAADIVAYLAGSRIGTRPLAPSISPGKTVEGVLAGGLAALVVGAVVGSQVTPWGGVKHGLELGLVVAVLSPVGDLFESMIKRDLSVKDSGSALPGHGGLLDRFDSLLVVLPAAYYLVTLFGLRL